MNITPEMLLQAEEAAERAAAEYSKQMKAELAAIKPYVKKLEYHLRNYFPRDAFREFKKYANGIGLECHHGHEIVIMPIKDQPDKYSWSIDQINALGETESVTSQEGECLSITDVLTFVETMKNWL